MRKQFFTAVAPAVVSLCSLWLPVSMNAQPALVTVDESGIRASLKGNPAQTVISLPVLNSSKKALNATVNLHWVLKDNSDTGGSAEEKDWAIPPGQSTVEIPLPMDHPSIWNRLRYDIRPTPTIGGPFARMRGIVAISQISDYVFELRATHSPTVRPGSTFTIHAGAIHPVTRNALPDIKWTATRARDADGDEDEPVKPDRIIKREGGFIDFVFTVPEHWDDDEIQVKLTAQRGDFKQTLSLDVKLTEQCSIRVQTDKPIYQPGQTVHMRAVVFNSKNRAAAGTAVQLRVHDHEEQLATAADLIASKFGIVQHDWTIPASATSGAYRITFENDEDRNGCTGAHAIRISRYELPMFTVTTKPDRTAYLPSETRARVTVSGAYLFGKPVPKGNVRIVRINESSRNGDESAAEGVAGEDGTYTANINLSEDHSTFARSPSQRFLDLHFAAYYTDQASGRTEQRKFDLRVTHDPIHVYITRGQPFTGSGQPVYVSTSYADGRPAPTSVEIDRNGVKWKLQTNRYGVGRIELPSLTPFAQEDRLKMRAQDAQGQFVEWLDEDWIPEPTNIRIRPAKTIHRAGEPVSLRLETASGVAANAEYLIVAITGDRNVAAQVVHTVNHKGTLTFPYQPEFRREVLFVPWNKDHPSRRNHRVYGAAVLFPDRPDLNVSASTTKDTYAPGEKPSLKMQVTSADGRPVQAAIGLAVVDQAVLERSRTDEEFGTGRSWFTCMYCGIRGEDEIGGIRLNDLIALKPGSPLSPDLDLVAEALLASEYSELQSETGEDYLNNPFEHLVANHIAILNAELDKHYARRLEFPKDMDSFMRSAGRQWFNFRDPWETPYTATFGVERQEDVITIRSAGPDKLHGTADDWIAGTIRREYFTPFHLIIERMLKTHQNYPATAADFESLLAANGIRLQTLHDPWGTPYTPIIMTNRSNRTITLQSAGPDRTRNTRDDFVVTSFTGRYFEREASEVWSALQAAANQPKTLDEFRATLDAAGVKYAAYRDPWGKPYRPRDSIDLNRAHRIRSQTIQVYGERKTTKSDLTPITQKITTFTFRSDGEDGIEGTGDDFDVARFPILQDDEADLKTSASPTSAPSAIPARKGTGSITGSVTDTTGAVIEGATVTLLAERDGPQRQTTTGPSGQYYFRSIVPGSYSIRVSASGFTQYVVTQVPVIANRTTSVDAELAVGSVSETVSVEAETPLLNTQSSMQTETRSASATGTPRVRDYFPETLIWLPEVITDTAGKAQRELPAADSITNWKIAAFASTLDGRVAEAESEFRTFQPFFVDFNPPPILTQGDRIELPTAIRNYLDQPQTVEVSLEANTWSSIGGSGGSAKSPAKQTAIAPAGSSANVSFSLQAKLASANAPLRLVAVGGRNHDAIEKPVTVNPDGQQITQTFSDYLTGSLSFNIPIPNTAIPAASRAELRIYPNIAALLFESAKEILERPHGCAEQTTSGGYANLVALRFARVAGISNALIEKRALEHVRIAVKALEAFTASDGGVSYWRAGESPDAALTAYLLGFLSEATPVVPVDKSRLERMVSWLKQAQTEDGGWTQSGGASSSARTGIILRSLAQARKAGVEVPEAMLTAAYRHLTSGTVKLNDPYTLANFILSTVGSGDENLVGDAVTRLTAMAHEQSGGLYWDLPTGTPFNGWGPAGVLENTGLVVSALSTWLKTHPGSPEIESQVRRGVAFILRGRDTYGTWHSTQSTVRSIRALADAFEVVGTGAKRRGTSVLEVQANGRVFKTIPIPADSKGVDPVIVDISAALATGATTDLKLNGDINGALVRVASSHWLPWESAAQLKTSPDLPFDVQFDRLETAARQPVRCRVKAGRATYRRGGYGMLLAEVGLPPGAEVDRSSIETAISNGSQGIDHYEVLPDRVVFYLWPRQKDAAFDFFLTLRFPMLAKSAPSVLYDYYNPDARTDLPPSRWRVH
jgi:hypothetical protein